MTQNVLHVPLHLVRDEMITHSLAEDFLILDNFSDIGNAPQIMSATDYPVKFDMYVIGFCLNGYSIMKMGQQQIRMKKNDFMTIIPGRVFHVLETSEDYKVAAILLNPNFFPFQGEFTQAYNLQGTLFSHPCHSLPAEAMEEMIHIYNLVKRKINEKGHTYRTQIVRHYLLIMFYNVCQLLLSAEQQTSKTDNRKEKLFSQFMKEVELHCRVERSVAFYANKLCLTPKYFSTLIHEISDKLPSEWIGSSYHGSPGPP